MKEINVFLRFILGAEKPSLPNKLEIQTARYWGKIIFLPCGTQWGI